MFWDSFVILYKCSDTTIECKREVDMKRYCISDTAYEKTSTSKMNLKIHPQTLMEFAKNVDFMNDIQQKDEPERDRMVALLSSLNSQTGESFNRIDNENKVKIDFFSECNEDIMDLYNVDSIASSEEEMYETILLDILQMPVVCLDISLHIYYTILYQKTEGKFINLLQDNWTKEEKENFRSQRKSWRAYKKKVKGLYIPFDIDGNTLNFEVYGYQPQKCIQIQDFAPDLVRLYYSNRELRNIFADTQSADTEKYYSKNISSVYQCSNIQVDRIEEIWLLERILGINLAREVYSLLYPILPKNFNLIESQYQPLIIEIVHEIMKLEGIYSRCLLVHKLKIITKIKIISMNLELNPLEFLSYLLTILQKSVKLISETFTDYEQSEYSIIKKQTEETGIDDLKDKCENLLEQFFYRADHYYWLNGIEHIDIDEEKFYSLIQKIVIAELRKNEMQKQQVL